jgi:hypothetical protein
MTTRSSFTQKGSTYVEWTDGSTEAGYNTVVITSTSDSGETTSDYGSYSVETSTTETYLDNIISTTVSTVEGGTRWTTSASSQSQATKTGVVFFVTELGSYTDIAAIFVETARTADAITTVETSTLGAGVAFATVVQANTSDADAEVLYLLSSRPSEWSGFSAATDQADSGTRFTLVPSFSTSQVSVSSTRSNISTLSEDRVYESKSITYATTTTTPATRTNVINRFSLPNLTSTQSFASITTTSSSMSYEAISVPSFTYGYYQTLPGAVNTTVNTTAWGQSWETQRRWHHTNSFHFLSSRPISFAIKKTTGVELTQSFSNTESTNISGSTSATESFVDPDDPDQEITDTVTFSSELASFSISQNGETIDKNAYVPLPFAVGTAAGGALSRTRWVEVGAAIGTQKGLFYTSPNSYNGFIATARAGGSVYMSQFIESSNNQHTIESDSITFRPFTTTTEQPFTTLLETQSMVFGLAGSTSATVLPGGFSNATASRILPAGGGPFSATVVERAGPGIYKDRLAGTTTSFGGEDTIYDPGATANRNKWAPIVRMQGIVQGSAPLLWAEQRNSTALPP